MFHSFYSLRTIELKIFKPDNRINFSPRSLLIHIHSKKIPFSYSTMILTNNIEDIIQIGASHLMPHYLHISQKNSKHGTNVIKKYEKKKCWKLERVLGILFNFSFARNTNFISKKNFQQDSLFHKIQRHFRFFDHFFQIII